VPRVAQCTASHFDRLENEMRTGFAEVRGKLDQTDAGRSMTPTD
jgi:hypothetical protein